MTRATARCEQRFARWSRAYHAAIRLRAPELLIRWLGRKALSAHDALRLARVLECVRPDWQSLRRSSPPPAWSARPTWTWDSRGGDA